MKQAVDLLAGTPTGGLSEVLEPRDGKLSRAVLRGERGRKAPDLPGGGVVVQVEEQVNRLKFIKG